MRGNITLAFFLCVVLCIGATTGLAQSRMNGKWATDRPADPLTISDAQRKQSVQLEVTIEGTNEDAKASGSITIGSLGGTFYTFKDGKVTGNEIHFRTGPQPTLPPWTIEMVDDNTVILCRGNLPLVGNNVLDLMSVIGGLIQPASSVQAVSAQAAAGGSISGIVQDPSKALIPGATVTATNADTGIKLTTVTNAAGRYAFPDAIPGRYTMAASLPGFKTTTVNNLSIGDTRLLQDLTLELAVRPSANPSAVSCSPNDVVWSVLLHRAK